MIRLFKNIKVSGPVLFSVALVIIVALAGCKKFIDIGAPVTSINQDNVYASDGTAASVLTGLYANMSSNNYTSAFSFTTGLSGDELNLLDLTQTDYNQIFTYSFVPPYENKAVNFWDKFYTLIYTINAAQEGLTASNSLSPGVKQQLLGEALFMRAFCYFYLVNCYGDVPLVLNTDYRANALLPRTAKATVYQQIVKDLKAAVPLLSSSYLDGDVVATGPSVERVRPTTWAAQALLARAYLYAGDYPNAEVQATNVINNSSMFHLENLDQVFLRTSQETIWALQVTEQDNFYFSNTNEGREYVLSARAAIGSPFVFALNAGFVQRFEHTDQRATHWIGTYSNGTNTYYFPYKYKIGLAVAASKEYPVVLRLAELYLIRAEARIQQGNISEGVADLNILRTRATDPGAAEQDKFRQLPLNTSKDQALRMLEYERMAELFTEMGHRWFDLKRSPGFSNPSLSRADEVMTGLKGNQWKSWAQLYPIPQVELERNPNLTGHQNPGYQQ